MAPRRSKKRSKAERVKVNNEEAGQREKSENVEDGVPEGKMDFGGLPDRDLKKNLGGCG